MDKVDYLDDERKKIWGAIEELRVKVKKYTPEDVSAITAQITQIQQALSASESSASRYQEILKKAESAITEIDASAISVNTKSKKVESQSAEALSNYDEIQTAAQNANAISKQADKIKVALETTVSDIVAKNEVLAEATQIHSSIEELLQKAELLHKNILDKERATTELHRQIF